MPIMAVAILTAISMPSMAVSVSPTAAMPVVGVSRKRVRIEAGVLHPNAVTRRWPRIDHGAIQDFIEHGLDALIAGETVRWREQRQCRGSGTQVGKFNRERSRIIQ